MQDSIKFKLFKILRQIKYQIFLKNNYFNILRYGLLSVEPEIKFKTILPVSLLSESKTSTAIFMTNLDTNHHEYLHKLFTTINK